jgi:hypothetical protein
LNKENAQRVQMVEARDLMDELISNATEKNRDVSLFPLSDAKILGEFDDNTWQTEAESTG